MVSPDVLLAVPDGSVMMRAERCGVFNMGLTTVIPIKNMMNIAGRGSEHAPRCITSSVPDQDGTTLCPGIKSLGPVLRKHSVLLIPSLSYE